MGGSLRRVVPLLPEERRPLCASLPLRKVHPEVHNGAHTVGYTLRYTQGGIYRGYTHLQTVHREAYIGVSFTLASLGVYREISSRPNLPGCVYTGILHPSLPGCVYTGIPPYLASLGVYVGIPPSLASLGVCITVYIPSYASRYPGGGCTIPSMPPGYRLKRESCSTERPPWVLEREGIMQEREPPWVLERESCWV